MAKPKPIIRRCLFCGECYDDAWMKDHYKDKSANAIAIGGRSNCKVTYALLAEGWKQSATGVWSLSK